ncbi:Kinesin light chain [Ilyonectria robusta]
MDASTHFHDTVSGQTTIAAPQASHGGSINFHFYGPGTQTPAAGRNPPTPCKPFSTVPFPPDPDFVDRPDILKWMHEKCARPAARIALVGLGGIGKSQLAIQYAHQVRQRAPNTWVFWVHASTRGRFEEAYQSIADRLELPRRNDPDVNICRLVSEWLRVEENGPWKMILDNADDVGVFFSNAQERLASFLPQSCNGSIVVTSRSMDVAERLVGGWSNILTIPAMKTEEACQLLREKLGVSYDDGAAADLVRDLNHMPLAITQAAAFINRRAPRMSIPAYLNEFRRSDKKKASLLNKDAGDLRRDESASNSIVTTWQITFEQIRHERPSAANMLSFMSFFNPQGIPESVLQAYACEYGEYGEDGLDQDIETLRGYSLVAVTADGEIFKMHALVQFCTQVWLSSFGDMQQWEREFLKVMSDRYPPGEYENWAECQTLDLHIDMIIKKEPGNREDIIRWARLLTNRGWYWRMRGRYKEAEQMNRRALNAREKVFGREHPSTLTSISNLALVLQHQGKYEEAEQMNRRDLDGCEKVLGREHPDTLTSVNNLAGVLQDQGKHEEAEQINRRALDAKEKVLGREHPSTLTSISDLALVLRAQGKYEEAEQMNRRALDAYEKVLGREHPDTLTSVNNLAGVLQYQGKYEEAEQMNRRALDAKEKVLGREHPSTLASVYNLAYLFHRQSRFAEADHLYERACSGYVEVLGSDHPTTRACVAHYCSLREDMANDHSRVTASAVPFVPRSSSNLVARQCVRRTVGPSSMTQHVVSPPKLVLECVAKGSDPMTLRTLNSTPHFSLVQRQQDSGKASDPPWTKRQRQQTMHTPPVASSTVKTHVARHPRSSCSPQQRLQRCSVEPSTIPSRLIEEDGDDVIYLGTFPRQAYHHTIVSTFRCPAIDSNRTLDFSPRRNSRKRKGRRAGQSLREQTDARTTQRKGARPSRQPTIPTAIMNQKVWLGRARDSTGQVYGFFDSAGRFCRRVEVERSGRATEHRSSFAHILHDQVVYRPIFQQMTYQQVRAEVCRRLVTKLGGSLDDGEI